MGHTLGRRQVWPSSLGALSVKQLQHCYPYGHDHLALSDLLAYSSPLQEGVIMIMPIACRSM